MKSMPLAVLVLLLLAGATALRAQDPAGVAPKPGVLKVVGVSVLAADPADSFRSFLPGQSPGLAVVLTYSDPPPRSVLGLVETSLRVTSFTDDKGTDLASGEAARLGSWPQVSEAKDRVAFSVVSETLPAAGAREVRLKGTISVLTGKDLRTATQEGVELKKGTAVAAGGLKATVSEVSDDGSGDSASRTVELTSEAGFAAIQSVEFLDGTGKPIEASEYGSSSMNDGERIIYGKSWNLPGQPAKVGLRVTYWEKVEAVEVPIDVAVGVGL